MFTVELSKKMPPAAMNFSSCLYVATTGQLTNEESKNHAAVKNQS